MTTSNAQPGLTGKIALISGASKGLGKAMALALSAQGASVALVSRNIEKLEESASRARGSRSKSCHLDR